MSSPPDRRCWPASLWTSQSPVSVSPRSPATVPGTVLASLVEQGHLPDPVAGLNNLHIGVTVSARLVDLSGKQIGGVQNAAIDVAAAQSTKAFAVAWTDALPDLHLLRLTLRDASGHTLSENTYWRYRTPSAMQALNKVPQTRLAASLGKVSGDGAGRRQATATVNNRGSAVAVMVRLSLLDRDSGDRILPTIYGDNYLWLLPGQTRTLNVSFPAAALPGGTPQLHVEGYNTAPIIAN